MLIICLYQFIVVIMSNTKPKINIQRALRELNLQVSQRYEPLEQHPLSQISSNIPFSHSSSEDISRKNSKDNSQAIQRSSKKINNKENSCDPIRQEIQPKSITYVAISKALQEKTQLIGQQKHQIEVLRQCVENLKNNKQVKYAQEGRKKSQELSILKEREKEYLQGLTEILGLKQNLQDIKRKYNHLTCERNSLQQERNCLIGQRNSLLAQRNLLAGRFDTLFVESEELTIAITHLKIQKQEREAAFRKMEDEMVGLKEQLRMKAPVQQRAINLQRRLSECMQKLGESQQELNACQFKYYRLQQDGDLIRLDGQQRLASLLRQCRSQRQEHQQETTKLTALLRQAELQKRQFQRKINEFQQKRLKQGSEQLINLRQSLKKSEQNSEKLRQEGKKWQSYTKQLTRHHQTEKQSQFTSFRTQIKSLKQELITVTQQLRSVSQEKDGSELKNQRTFINFSALLQEKQDEVKKIHSLLLHSEQELSSLRYNVELKCKHQAYILMKIQVLQRSLTDQNLRLTQINSSLQAQNNKISAELCSIDSERECLIEQRNRLRQQLNAFRENQQSDIRYYQQKYEHQLLEYNNLSEYSHSMQLQHTSLLNSHTSLLSQSNTLKTQIARLNEQVKQIKDEMTANQRDIGGVRTEAARWKLQAINLQTEMGRMQLQIRRQQQIGKQWQKRAQQRQNGLRQVRGQVSQQILQINCLKSSIMTVQQSYSSLLQQHNAQLYEWERKSEAARLQRSQLQNSRKSAQYELDNSQATISILKQQNVELHHIFSGELQRRNSIIRQLMAQKKALYGQLVGREDYQ